MIKNCMKRYVMSIPSTATIRQAAELVVERHIGSLPVVDDQGKLIGAVRLADLLSLEMPVFFDLLPELDFVHDFGAVESRQPSAEELDRSVLAIMQPAIFVEETCGLLRAYAMLVKHNIYDLLVVSEDGALVGVASRVDIGAAVLSTWKSVPHSSP